VKFFLSIYATRDKKNKLYFLGLTPKKKNPRISIKLDDKIQFSGFSGKLPALALRKVNNIPYKTRFVNLFLVITAG